MKDISLKQAAIITGIGLILMAILAPIANFSILEKLIAPGNAAKTTDNIIASKGHFRIGICCFMFVAVLDVIVAWALYIFLKPVNRSLSLLTACLRIVYATLLAAILTNLIYVLQLTSGADYLSPLQTNQLQAQIMLSLDTFNLGWQLGLIVFGFHLLLLGYLFFKAGYMRKILGILLMLAAVGYSIDGFGKLLSPNYNTSIAMFTFIGEVILIFWLLIKGTKIQTGN
jgi:hypothetical protein